MDWDEKQEQYRRRNEEAREYLAQLNAKAAARDAVEVARSSMVEHQSYYLEPPSASNMQHFGSVSVPLRSSEPMRRWRAEAEAKKRRQQAYAAEQEREWQERQRQAAMPEMPQVWIDAIGEAMSEYVANQVDGLRAEVERDIHRAVKRTYGTDEILDLPALPFRRRSDAA